MRRNTDFKIVEIADEHIVVALGDTTDSFPGIVTLSQAGAYLPEHFDDANTVDSIAALLMREYEVDKDTALHDVSVFVDKLVDIGLIVR